MKEEKNTTKIKVFIFTVAKVMQLLGRQIFTGTRIF